MSGQLFAAPAQKYRLGSPPASPVDSQLPSVAGAAVDDAAQLHPLHPSSPLLVFGVLAAMTFGLMAASASVRVGKTTAGVHVGDTHD